MSNSLAVQKLKNVFVTNNSVIIERGTILKNSCVSEKQYKEYQKAKFLLKYIFPFFIFSSKQHILITDEWSKNYCHFLWEALSKLIVLQKEFNNPILVLPKSYVKIDFVMKSLEIFGFNRKNIKFIAKKSRVKIKNLAFIPCINIGAKGYYDFLKFKKVREIFLDKWRDQFTKNFGEKIYISRSNPQNLVSRRVSNEEELVAMLENYGFKTVYMEKFSFIEQVSIMSFAKHIIAPHGAGITNVMFAKEGCHLLELINENRGILCFERMCKKMQISYDRFDCKPSDENSSEELANIEVDVIKLENKIKNITI